MVQENAVCILHRTQDNHICKTVATYPGEQEPQLTAYITVTRPGIVTLQGVPPYQRLLQKTKAESTRQTV